MGRQGMGSLCGLSVLVYETQTLPHGRSIGIKDCGKWIGVWIGVSRQVCVLKPKT